MTWSEPRNDAPERRIPSQEPRIHRQEAPELSPESAFDLLEQLAT